MDLSNLKPAEGSVQSNNKRVGRGQGSGKGGTSTRGHNGAKSRSGYSRKIGFVAGLHTKFTWCTPSDNFGITVEIHDILIE